MKSLFVVLSLTLSLSATSAFAAKFTPVKMKSAAARELQQTVNTLIKGEGIFGDAGFAKSYSFTRKATEVDLQTMKQLNFAKAGLNSDDKGAILFQSKSAKQLAEYLLEALRFEESSPHDDAVETLSDALSAVKAERNLVIYGTNHADEDGSWQILDILDTKNDEVLIIRIGYHGT